MIAMILMSKVGCVVSNTPKKKRRTPGHTIHPSGNLLHAVAPKFVTDRILRIFVSSTFADMTSERSVLMTRVFPEIVKICDAVGVVPVLVDLRWGVSQDQVAEQCMGEVQKSDVFLGFIGMRYGWHDHGMNCPCGSQWFHLEGKSRLCSSIEVASQHLGMPWLLTMKDRSVTELEIRCAERYVSPACTFFYLRDPSVGAIEGSPKGRHQLELLRKELAHRGALWYNDANSEQFSQSVLQNVRQALDLLYPSAHKPNKWLREVNIHMARASKLTLAVVERPSLTEALLKAIKANPGKRIGVVGEAGLGKSTLIALVAKKLDAPQSKHIVHFIGCTADSSVPEKVARRLLYELQEPLPEEDEAVMEALPEVLRRHSPLTILLDGIDFVHSTTGSILSWMPQVPGVTWVMSSRDPSSFTDGSFAHVVTVSPFDAKIAAEAITKFLQARGKSLTQTQSRSILSSKACTTNPLFLRLVLNELCAVGNFESLNALIAKYVEAATLPELIARILQRLRTSYDERAVHGICSALVLSQIGLSESEFVTCSKTDAATVMSCLDTLEPVVVHRAGTLIGDDLLRHGVMQSILQSEAEVRKGHKVLSEFFGEEGTMPLDKRVLRELPLHLQKSGNNPSLVKLLGKPKVLMEMFHDHKCGEYVGYLTFLRQSGTFIPDIFQKTVYSNQPPNVVLTVSRVLGLMGYYAESKSWLMGLLATDVDTRTVTEIHRRLAMSEISLGNFDAAVQRATTCLQMAHSQKASSYILLDSTRLLALAHKKKGNYREALPLYRSVISQATTQHIASLVSSKMAHFYEETGDVLRDMGNYAEAESFHLRALDMKRRAMGETHLATCMAFFNLAATHKKQGKYVQATNEVEFAIQGFEKAYGVEHPALCAMLNLKGSLLRKASLFDGALVLYQRVLKMNVRCLGEGHVDTGESYMEVGMCLKKQGHYKDAEEHLQHALTIFAKLFGEEPHVKTAETYNQLSDVLRKMSRFKESIAVSLKAKAIFEKVYTPGHPDIAECRMCIGLNYLKLETEINGALQLFREALQSLVTALGDTHAKVATCHTYLGDAYRKDGDLLKARDHYTTALRISEEVYGDKHVEVAEAHYKLGRLFKKLHWYNDASTKFHRALQIIRSVLGSEQHAKVAVFLYALADVNRKVMSYEVAEDGYHRALAILLPGGETGDRESEDVAECFNGLGMCAFLCGDSSRRQEAVEYVTRSVLMTERLLGSAHRHSVNRRRNLSLVKEEITK